MNREEGYYWVKVHHEKHSWEPMHYGDEGWYYADGNRGDGEILRSEQLNKIGPKIEPPK